jgi:myo-inositol 2-dehydrogenase/D-chiro-inositol 1-dehydrogenase
MARIRVGFAGCGEVSAEKHLPALAEVPAFEVVAAADTDGARRAYMQRRHRVPHIIDSVDALLGHDGLDAVALCLPPALQVDAAIAALDAGKHVWIDPPTGLTLADCDRLIARAARSDRTVIVGFHMRWHRLVRQARAVIDSGRLGTLHASRAVWSSPRHVERLKDWRRHRAAGGGALVEVAIDHIDLWRFLLGSEIAQLHAFSMNDEWDDAAAVVAGRMEHGVLLSGVFAERANHDVEIEIFGEGGRLRVSLVRFEGLEFVPAGAMASDPAQRMGRLAHFLKELPAALPRMHRAGDYRTSYRDQWHHFAQCIQTGNEVACTLGDARQSLRAMLAGLESASATSSPPAR